MFALIWMLAQDAELPPPPPVDPPAAEAPQPVPPTPPPGSEGDALPAEEVRQVQLSEVMVKRKVIPKYPTAAKGGGLEGSCTVRVFIDEKGKPYDVKVETCDESVQTVSLAAARDWRFYPYMPDGKTPTPVQFVLAFNFKLAPGP